jgi:hypothetical protein
MRRKEQLLNIKQGCTVRICFVSIFLYQTCPNSGKCKIPWRLPNACRLCPGVFAAAWGHRRGGGMGSVRAPSVCVGFMIWDPGRPSRSCDLCLHGVKPPCMRLWRLPDACRLCPGVFAAAWGHRRGGGMGSVRAPSVCVGFVIWDPGRPSWSCDSRLPGVKLACMHL